MKSSQITLIVIGFILLALMATNPSIEDHRQAVVEKGKEKLNESSATEPNNNWQKAGEAIGMAIGQGIIEKAVSRNNYLLFSLTKITFGDKSKNIGFGILGNVWITKVDLKEVENISSDNRSINPVDTIPIVSSHEQTIDDNNIDDQNATKIKYILGCYPPNGTNLILKSPDVNDIHPAWKDNLKGGSSLGSGWSFNAVKKVETEKGVFLLGNIFTSRGGLFNSLENGYYGMVYVPLKEWECSTYPQ